MRRIVAVLSLVFVVALGARIYANTITPQIGGGINQFDGGMSNSGAPAAPLTPCTSTGIFDLSNTCNDIYFIGALK